MGKIGTIVKSTPDAGNLEHMNNILAMLCASSNLQVGVIYIADGDYFHYLVTHGVVAKGSLQAGSPLTMISHGKKVIELNISNIFSEQSGSWKNIHPKIKYLIGIPLRLDNDVIGGVCLMSEQDGIKLTRQQKGCFKTARILIEKELDEIYSGKDIHPDSSWLKVIDSTSDIVICIDDQGDISHWNSQATNILGWLADEVLSKSIIEILFPFQDRNNHSELSNTYTSFRTAEIKTKNQQHLVIDLKIERLNINKSLSSCWIIKNYSMLDRAIIEAEAARVHSEKVEFRAQMGSWYYEFGGKSHWSKQLLKMLGFEDGILVPSMDKLLTRIHSDDKNYVREAIDQVLSGEEPKLFMIRSNPEILGERYFLPSIELLRNSKGQLYRVEGTLEDVTEDMEQRKSVQRAESLYMRLFENAMEGIFQSSPEGKILTVNPMMANIFGYNSADEMLKEVKNIGAEIYTDPQKRIELMQLLQKHKSVKDYIAEGKKKSGEKIWLQANIYGIYKDEKLILLEGNVRDITSEKRAYEQLLKEKQLADTIINSMPGIFYLYNKDGKFLRWNDNFEKVTGYSSEEMETLHPIELFAEGPVRDLLQSKIATVFEQGYEEVEAPFLLKNGQELEFFFNGWRINYEGEECLIGVGINIERIKKAEKNLQTSEATLKAFFQSSSDVNILLDDNLHIIKYNMVASDLMVGLNWKPLENQRSIYDWLNEDWGIPEVEVLLNQALMGEVNKREVYLDGDHDKKGWWLFTFGPAFTKSGEVFGGIIHATNINIIKNTQSALQQTNLSLKKLNKELDQFVYKVSHDLKGPLATISGLINVAERDVPHESSLKYFKLIHECISKLYVFIDELIDYSHNSHDIVQSRVIDFNRILIKTKDRLKFMEGLSSLNIRFEVEKYGKFNSDPDRLQVIFNNMIANAVKFRDPEKDEQCLTIQVSFSKTQVEIIFTDNGLGIPTSQTNKIFEMFYRGHTISNGAGLGLYITREIIDKLQGSIQVKSEIGKYTEFTIKLPRHNYDHSPTHHNKRMN
ncbi:PAS domain S-box protein [Fulvivirga ligni]|uniref:PAS domain S-box protein n=1 Tax=Fulvivirga ligni TaxID=2904246 RepID=UPI001F271D25|nr:PAS domain S-box protein [Fulvivirga ligni]UII20863.1 PAS domain S-box protein [Fulvivirga ligni]